MGEVKDNFIGSARGESGALYVSNYIELWSAQWDENGEAGFSFLNFDASRVVPTASDNRPYSMYLVPLISY